MADKDFDLITFLPDDVSVDSTQTLLPLSDYTNSSASNVSNQNSSHSGYDCIGNNSVAPYGLTAYRFQATHSNELSFSAGEIVKLKRYVDQYWLEGEIDGRTGIFPVNFINIVVDCPISEQNVCKENENVNVIDVTLFPPNTHGKVILDFIPEGKIQLNQGDNVTLTRNVDQNCYEVATDNQDTCVCPKSCIEVIDDRLPSYNEVMAANHDFPIANCGKKQRSVDSRFDDSLNYSVSFFDQSKKETFSQSGNRPQGIDDKVPETLNLDLCTKSSSSDLLSTCNNSFSDFNPKSFSDNAINLSQDIYHANKSSLSRNSCTDIPTENKSNSSSISSAYSCASPVNKQLITDTADSKSQVAESESKKLEFCDAQARGNGARKKEMEHKRKKPEKTNKIKEQRNCLITELLQTEKDYLFDLKLLHDLFLKNPTEAKENGIDVQTLFGNLHNVIDVTEAFLKRLQKVSKEHERIGECFVDVGDNMKEVYGQYCRNHDEVNSIIDKIDPKSPAGLFLNRKTELMKEKRDCFDLSTMLIKPVQRILKYPLLLNELLKCTEESHPDKHWLQQATHMMTDVAAAVNEFKRKKDLVVKYHQQGDKSMSLKISKFNFDSMAKKTSRLGMRLSKTMGLKSFSANEEFEKVEQRFKKLEESIKLFQKDVCDYMGKVEELVTTAFNVSEEIADWYEEKRDEIEVEKFCSVHRTVLYQHWKTFKQIIEHSVCSTLKRLLVTFDGPLNVIEKRNDKFLDYEFSSRKAAKNKDVTKIKTLQDDLTKAKNNYEALNSQLLDDLPKLCDISVEIFYDCIRCFLKAKMNFVGKTAIILLDLTELPLFLGSHDSTILKTFLSKHASVIDNLSRLAVLPKEMCISIKEGTLKKYSPRGNRLLFSKPLMKS